MLLRKSVYTSGSKTYTRTKHLLASYHTVQSTIWNTKILTRKIFHIVRSFKSDNYFIIRAKNIHQPQRQQTSTDKQIISFFHSKKILN